MTTWNEGGNTTKVRYELEVHYVGGGGSKVKKKKGLGGKKQKKGQRRLGEPFKKGHTCEPRQAQ